MTSILDSVNQRTQMVGQNRLELLLFKLAGPQVYGINVFKVREVLQCPALTEIPQRHSVVRGVAHIRGATISVMDLSSAIGGPPIKKIENSFVIIAEYNRSVQGFLVNSVARIVNLNWSEILPPPKGSGSDHYLTAVTEIDKQIVEIIDVEKILSQIAPASEVVSEEVLEMSRGKAPEEKIVLVADDSAVARNQIRRTVEQLGLNAITVKDGKDALEYLEQLVEEGKSVNDELLLLISDVEMPEMDGYTLTAEIRSREELRDIWVLLHTSLSGIFNKAMVDKVGANDFIPKFNPDELARAVQKRLENQ